MFFLNLLLDMLVFCCCANLLFFLRAEWGRAYSKRKHNTYGEAFVYDLGHRISANLKWGERAHGLHTTSATKVP